jgi:hypothetical protein
MTRATLYQFEGPDGHLTATRYYAGVGFGNICAALPAGYDEAIDGRLREANGSFTRARLRAWINTLPGFEPPRSLADIADLVDGIGTTLEPTLALRLFLERVIAEMDAQGATIVHIARD